MTAIPPGSTAPPIPGVAFDRPKALYFFKVTCPVCQLSAPVSEAFERAYPGRIVGVGQDPPGKLGRFSGQFGLTYPFLADDPPYPVSAAYGLRVVPTLFLVDEGGTVLESVESWDREGFNRVSEHLAELTGAPPAEVSNPSDGLPPFRPG